MGNQDEKHHEKNEEAVDKEESGVRARGSAVLVLQTTTPVQAAVTLGPTKPSNFKEGNESQSRRPATGFRFSQLARNFTAHIVQQTENRQGRKTRE